MIDTIATIAAIAEKKFSDPSDHIETTLQRSQRSQRSQRQRSLRFFFSSISAVVAILAIIWKPLSSDHSDRSDHMKNLLGLKCKSLAQLPGDCLQFRKVQKILSCAFCENFLREYLNKVTLDRLIFFAKIFEFIFACIDHNSPNRGERKRENNIQICSPLISRSIITNFNFYNVKVFRYSFSEAIPIFFNRLKSGFLLVRSL